MKKILITFTTLLLTTNLSGCTLLGLGLELFTPVQGTIQSPSLVANAAEYDAKIIKNLMGVQSTARCKDLQSEAKVICERRAAAISRNIEKHQSKN
ncbi:hypothetical protein [Pseudoalteromonas piscicida]|uniref:Uncharacterized protein n=1 Tax=Pseudoalteromonas piscicida TaxID=43662 RepID=A0A2A5JSN4_PSEO7|nr:hypothetical protein [Pseudoalteromonas piscicida]PCK32482.1 hypothetical protein CEX98_07070 [Pseudoalteromonas piscicida]